MVGWEEGTGALPPGRAGWRRGASARSGVRGGDGGLRALCGGVRVGALVPPHLWVLLRSGINRGNEAKPMNERLWALDGRVPRFSSDVV